MSVATSADLGSRFWWLLSASTASTMSEGIARAVFPLLAASLTRDPVMISLITTLSFLPWLLFSLPAGAYVDRNDRRRVMVGATAFRFVAFGVLAVAVLADVATMPILLDVVFAVGTVETFYDNAMRAILPQVVRRDQLDRSNGYLSAVELSGQSFLGAPIGTLLFAIAVILPLAVNMTAFVVAALILLLMGGSYRPARKQQTTLGRDIADGVRWLWRHRFLRGLTVANGITSAFQSMANAILVLYALDVLHLPEAAFGLVLVAAGLGGLLGGLAVPTVSARLGRVATLSATSLLFPLALGAMSVVTHPVGASVLYGLAALFVMAGNVLSMSVRQAMIPDELFGRAQGAYRTIVWGGIPFGSLLGGLIASATSVRAVFAVAGAGSLLVGMRICILLHRHRDEIAAAYS